MTDQEQHDGKIHKSVFIQCLELLAYYGAIALILWLVAIKFPGFIEHLPVGGAIELGQHMDGNSFEPVVTRVMPAAVGSVHASVHLILAILAAFLFMLPVTWVYMGTRKRKNISQSFVNTILLLPIAVTGIVHIVQNSLALAFSLAGIVAGVRFRHTLKDTGDTMYLFTAILMGLSAGIGAVDVAAVASIMFNMAVLLLWRTEYASDATGTQSFSRNWMTKKPNNDPPETED